jgi:hypothetical protein
MFLFVSFLWWYIWQKYIIKYHDQSSSRHLTWFDRSARVHRVEEAWAGCATCDIAIAGPRKAGGRRKRTRPLWRNEAPAWIVPRWSKVYRNVSASWGSRLGTPHARQRSAVPSWSIGTSSVTRTSSEQLIVKMKSWPYWRILVNYFF